MGRLITLLFLTLLLVQPVHATVYMDCDFESAPSSEVEGGTYTCDTGTASLDLGSNLSGNVFDHDTTGGWGGGGAPKFFSHISAESFNSSNRWLNLSSSPASTSQINMRWLMFVENNLPLEIGGKPFEQAADTGVLRTWLAMGSYAGTNGNHYQPEICYNGTACVKHAGGYEGPGSGYQYCTNPSTWWDSELVSCTIQESTVFDWWDYLGEWVAFEIEKKTDGTYQLYIWTQDGVFDGEYYETESTATATNKGMFGAFLEGDYSGNKYWLLDELRLDDAYIGPPAGFLDAETPAGVFLSVGN